MQISPAQRIISPMNTRERKQQKIGIAISGGVDSTAVALLLKKRYGAENLCGFFMRLAQPDFARQLAQVQDVTKRIGIALQVIDLREEFQKRVLGYFAKSYFLGRTPNPCVICNTEIKFGLFLDVILQNGMEYAASGHYAKIVRNKECGSCHLFMGDDPKKDQSYFLSRLSQKQLQKLLFPLGGFTKEEIYTIVEKEGFTNFRGKESQDVCFLEKGEIKSFLESYKRREEYNKKGAIITNRGERLGEHNGIFHYTVGQRKGLGIAYSEPLYVTSLNAENNTVYVGTAEELLRKSVSVSDLHWIGGAIPDTAKPFWVRIRSTHRGAAAFLILDKDKEKPLSATIEFDEPQRAVTPGQFAVFYHNKELIGSAIIE